MGLYNCDKRILNLCGIICVVLTSITPQISTVEIGGSINVDLSTFDRFNKSTHVFPLYDILNGYAVVNVSSVPKDVGFFVIQVHSYEHPVLLSNHSIPGLHTSVNGTNIGLVQIYDDYTTDNFRFYLRCEVNTTIFVVIVAYVSEDPIPGGCNLKFGLQLAPYQIVSYNDYLIEVDSQAGSVAGHICEEHVVKSVMYHMFLEEWDLSSLGYFRGLERMLTVDNIVKYGTKVSERQGYSYLRRFYNAYRGTGSVYAIVARFGNVSSAYVPAVSYACDIAHGAESCYGPVTIYWRVICGLMVFFGLFMCFVGHRFFQVTLFFTGFSVAAALAYVTVSYTDITFGESLITLGVIGVIYGAFWVIIWCKFGIPLLSVTLSFAVAGYLVASIFFYMGLADVPVFVNDINYWSVMVGVSLLVTVVLLVLSPFNSNIVATSFLGSYVFIIPIDHYIGGNLRYIFLNTLYRATVPEYNLAVVDPPFQSNDQNLAIFWTLLTIAGIYAQWRQNKGRAPFPPPAVIPRNGGYSERTPLITVVRTGYSN